MFAGGSVPSYQNELIFWPFTYFGSFGQPGIPVMYFTCESQKIKKYNEWLETDKRIFMKPYIKTIPKPLTFCEELFDKNVLEIKELVKDIGNLTPLIHKEQKKNIFLYDDSNVITDTFLTEVNKNIKTYGLISIEYNDNNENLINSKNRLRFKIKYISKEFITLQLEYILTPKKIEPEDSKITNFSNLSVDKFKMQITNEFKIEGFQNFEKYSTINPVNVKITDSTIQNSLLIYASKYKYRFIAKSFI